MQNDEEQELKSVGEIVGRLAAKFPDVPRSEIEDIVHAEHLAFTGKPVRDFVPVLVEKKAKNRLRHRAVAAA